MAVKEIAKRSKLLSYIARCITAYNYKGNDPYRLIPDAERRAEFMHVSFSDARSKELVYLIDYYGGVAGFFAIYRHLIQLLFVCDIMNMTPYINVYGSRYNDGHDNVFDFFFEQPVDLSLEQVIASSNVICANLAHLKVMDEWFGKETKETDLIAGYDVSEDFISRAAEIRKKFFKMKPEVEERFASDIEGLIGTKKTLAIHYRGNAYRVGFSGHPIELSIDDYFPHIEECLRDGYEQLFVATDEANIIEVLKERYPRITKCYQDTFRSSNGYDVHSQVNERDNNGYLLAFEVMRDMLTLASCEGLLCGNSQVTIAARIQKASMGKGYEYLEVLSRGFYEGDNTKAIAEYRGSAEYKPLKR